MKTILGDRYELGERIGSGGMATVHSGTDRVLGRPVAVKILAEHLAADEGFVERFRREARAAAGLNHPNVVSVYDTGDDGDTHYIVMELVEGRTLADMLSAGERPSHDRAATIAAAACRALGAAHARGLVHRDVKPANILVTPAGEVKVTDFGIARLTAGEPLTVTGSILGTASYISPEQARGDAVDARSDLYSLGCVLYEMLAGRPPFQAENPVAVAAQHLNENPTPPSTHDPNLPKALEATVLRAMSKNPTARPQTAQQMEKELKAATGGEETQEVRRTDTKVLPVTKPEAPGEDGKGPKGRRARRAGSPEGTREAGAAPHPVGRHRRANPLPWSIAAGALAVAAVALVMARGPEPAAVRSPEPASQPTTPATIAPEVFSVESAYQQLATVLHTTFESQGIAPEAYDDLRRGADEALAAWQEGKQEDAVARAAEVQGLVLAYGEQELILSELVSPIADAAADFTQALRVNPPPVQPEEEDEGDNRGKGKGKGKNKNGGDDD